MFKVFELLTLYKGRGNTVKHVDKSLRSNVTLFGLFDYYKEEVPADFKILLILVLIEFLKSIIKLLLIVLLSSLSR